MHSKQKYYRNIIAERYNNSIVFYGNYTALQKVPTGNIKIRCWYFLAGGHQ